MDSQVSISYADSLNSPDVYDTWTYAHESFLDRSDSRAKASSTHLPISESLRVVNPSSPPLEHRHATSPPTPEPVSATSMADSYQSYLTEHPARQSLDTTRALSSHPVHSTTTSLPLPKVSLPHEMFPVRHPRGGKDIDLKHPAPRRFASHPVLLQRASSIASPMDPPIATDSPGPPPRSPLRLRRDQQSIDSAMASRSTQKQGMKAAPSVADIDEYTSDILPIKPTVTTDCTGPIKRPSSRGKNFSSRPMYSSARKDRAERTKARKLRDKPTTTQTIETVIGSPPRSSRQRLKKARPQISIPDLRPAPLTTRSSSTASSNASWKKIREFTRTPVSAVPSETTPISLSGEPTGYTPNSPTVSSGSAGVDTTMALSPVMLVAEEVPVQRAKNTTRPARLVVKEARSYAPRPRSASVPRSAMKRRSFRGSQSTTRANSPAPEIVDDEAPPLPSPPPNRRLPPTPPASGSERPKRAKTVVAHPETQKDLPAAPKHEPDSQILSLSDRAASPQQAVPQRQRHNDSTKNPRHSAQFDARLAALEHHNKLLSAALVAVLRTNGERNTPLAELAALEKPRSPAPAAWETRLARRKASDAASNAASSSNGSALEMYMSTRRGSRHGF